MMYFASWRASPYCSYRNGAQGRTKYHHLPMGPQLRAPSGKPSKIIQLQVLNKKSPKFVPSPPKQYKNDTNIKRIPIHVKSLFLQHLSHQMLGSGSTDVQIQTPKSLKNAIWKQAWVAKVDATSMPNDMLSVLDTKTDNIRAPKSPWIEKHVTRKLHPNTSEPAHFSAEKLKQKNNKQQAKVKGPAA